MQKLFKEFFLLLFCIINLIQGINIIDIQSSHNNYISDNDKPYYILKEGEKITISCTVNENFQSCSFKHMETGKQCVKNKTMNTENNCNEFQNRDIQIFTSNCENCVEYCSLTIKSTTIEDSGKWICQFKKLDFDKSEKEVSAESWLHVTPLSTNNIEKFELIGYYQTLPESKNILTHTIPKAGFIVG